MIALRLLNTESQDKADYLHNQLITDINVPSTYWECAESYLKGVENLLATGIIPKKRGEKTGK